MLSGRWKLVINRIIESYEATGQRPVRGAYANENGEVCALGVLICGEQLELFTDGFWDIIQLSPTEHCGFTAGFDGRPRNGRDEQAYRAGRVCARVVFRKVPEAVCA